jgi:putative SOS response-associated peptidase YedK
LAGGRTIPDIPGCPAFLVWQIGIVCNIYLLGQKKGADNGVRGKVASASATLASQLVRKSDPGVVVLAGDRVEVMRWGFHRSFNAAINNARSDKLATGMWSEAFRDRRCVIPVSAFYEWGPGASGRKRAYAFSAPDGECMWMAGLWEPGGETGPCYTMVTTAAPPLMASIHDRMPAVLHPDEVTGFLAGDNVWNFQPFGGDLVVEPCASPLKTPRGDGGQRELF